jgi:hypothetical protein
VLSNWQQVSSEIGINKKENQLIEKTLLVKLAK